MARVAEWDCRRCKALWLAPVGNVNHVVSKSCPRCRKGVAMAWGRAAKEDGLIEVTEEEAL